jgi:hypothetical protein
MMALVCTIAQSGLNADQERQFHLYLSEFLARACTRGFTGAPSRTRTEEPLNKEASEGVQSDFAGSMLLEMDLLAELFPVAQLLELAGSVAS